MLWIISLKVNCSIANTTFTKLYNFCNKVSKERFMPIKVQWKELGRLKIKTELKIDGINELEKLLKEQQRLLKELNDNMQRIENIRVDLNLVIEKTTAWVALLIHWYWN